MMLMWNILVEMTSYYLSPFQPYSVPRNRPWPTGQISGWSAGSLSMIVNRQTLVTNDITSYNHIRVLRPKTKCPLFIWIIITLNNVHFHQFLTEAQVATVSDASFMADFFNFVLIVFVEEGLFRSSAPKTISCQVTFPSTSTVCVEIILENMFLFKPIISVVVLNWLAGKLFPSIGDHQSDEEYEENRRSHPENESDTIRASMSC